MARIAWQNIDEKSWKLNAEESINCYNKSLEIKRELDNQMGIAEVCFHFGRLLNDLGNKEKAEPLLFESKAIFERIAPTNTNLKTVEREIERSRQK